ncbi:hypothetical protein HanHA300_Chr17g0677061 [Helianthus annuus]|nr:hypothetical protein HanHA300_Chr17g0677061 [Helianthus annuus]
MFLGTTDPTQTTTDPKILTFGCEIPEHRKRSISVEKNIGSVTEDRSETPGSCC